MAEAMRAAINSLHEKTGLLRISELGLRSRVGGDFAPTPP
jgi:hypothetical protein